MWLAFPLILLVVLFLAGGLVAGGVYAIVLVPIAVIIMVAAVIFTVWGRSTNPSNIPGEGEGVAPLPHTTHANTVPSPTTPDQLVDAQRHAQ